MCAGAPAPLYRLSATCQGRAPKPAARIAGGGRRLGSGEQQADGDALTEARSQQRRVEPCGLERPWLAAAAAKSKRPASVPGLLAQERDECQVLAVGDSSLRLDGEHASAGRQPRAPLS